jgi:hypothetical protein
VLAPSLASLLLAAAPARPGVVVDADPCLELDAEELRATVELRLGAGPEYRGDAAGGTGDTQVLLDCAAEGRAELTIIDPLSETSATRLVDLPAPERRSEELGWAAAAMLRATWMSLALDPRTQRDRARRRAIRVARRPPSAWELGDGFAVRAFFDPGAPRLMLGEQVEVVHRPLRHLAWKADGELAYWRVPVESGGSSGRVNTLSISAAPALLGWGELPGRGRGGAGTVAIYGGAGLRVGGVRMRSATFGNSPGFMAYAGPLAMARVSVSLGRYVRLAVNAETGWILHGPEQPSGIPLSFVGPWANGVIVIVSSF